MSVIGVLNESSILTFKNKILARGDGWKVESRSIRSLGNPNQTIYFIDDAGNHGIVLGYEQRKVDSGTVEICYLKKASIQGLRGALGICKFEEWNTRKDVRKIYNELYRDILILCVLDDPNMPLDLETEHWSGLTNVASRYGLTRDGWDITDLVRESFSNALRESSDLTYVSKIPSYYRMPNEMVFLDTESGSTAVSAMKYSNGQRRVEFSRITHAGFSYPGAIICEPVNLRKSGLVYRVAVRLRNTLYAIDQFEDEDDAAELFDEIINYTMKKNFTWDRPQVFSREVTKAMQDVLNRFGNM